jgi:hypothetical protein
LLTWAVSNPVYVVYMIYGETYSGIGVEGTPLVWPGWNSDQPRRYQVERTLSRSH